MGSKGILGKLNSMMFVSNIVTCALLRLMMQVSLCKTDNQDSITCISASRLASLGMDISLISTLILCVYKVPSHEEHLLILKPFEVEAVQRHDGQKLKRTSFL